MRSLPFNFKTWEQWFNDIRPFSLVMQKSDPAFVTPHPFFEDMYQAFKARYDAEKDQSSEMVNTSASSDNAIIGLARALEVVSSLNIKKERSVNQLIVNAEIAFYALLKYGPEINRAKAAAEKGE